MEITVNLSESDIIALNDHIARTVPAVRNRILIAWVLMPALVALLLYNAGTRSIVGLALSALIVLVAGPPLVRTLRHRNIRVLLRSGSNLEAFGRQCISITPEAITRYNEYSRSSHTWRAVDRIDIGDEHAFVFVTSMKAIVIPKRDVHPGVFDEFVRTAQEYLEQSLLVEN